MAENKTKPTGASVEDYIASRANAQQSADCRELMALFKKVTRQSPKMWGPSIVGYGSYKYTYESGRSGEAPLAGFAIRGRELVVYLLTEGEEQKSLLSKLGKHKMGKVCLYFKQLADLDKSALENLIVGSVAEVKRRHGWAGRPHIMKDADANRTGDSASQRSEWQCCFCGLTIRERGAKVAITHADGAVQGLRSHARCLKERLQVPFLDVDDEATSIA